MINFDVKTEEQKEVIKVIFEMIEDLRGKYTKEQILEETKDKGYPAALITELMPFVLKELLEQNFKNDGEDIEINDLDYVLDKVLKVEKIQEFLEAQKTKFDCFDAHCQGFNVIFEMLNDLNRKTIKDLGNQNRKALEGLISNLDGKEGNIVDNS